MVAAVGVESPEWLPKVATARVLGPKGEPLQLRELWRDAPALTAFLRHYGCLFCHQMADEVLRIVPEVIARGGRVVLVGNGTVEEAQRFFSSKGLPRGGCVTVTDPERETYRAADMARGFTRTFLNRPSQRAFARARAEGHRITGLFGDLTQLGAALVTRPPVHLVYFHRSEYAGDHPSPTALLAAVDEARSAHERAR